MSETSPPEFRGLFLSMSSTCIAVGLGLMSFIGVYLPWNIASTIMCSFAMLAFILTFLYHEPASWLVQMGRLDEAEQSLKRVELPENVNARLKEIQEAKAEREKEGGGLKIGKIRIRTYFYIGFFEALCITILSKSLVTMMMMSGYTRSHSLTSVMGLLHTSVRTF